MILFRCFFSKFWTDQNRPLIWKLMQSPGNLLCLLFRITKRYALTSTTIQTTIIIGWIVLICSFTNEGPGFDFAVVLPSYPGQYQRVVPSHAHIHPLSERGVRHCTQYLRLIGLAIHIAFDVALLTIGEIAIAGLDIINNSLNSTT